MLRKSLPNVVITISTGFISIGIIVSAITYQITNVIAQTVEPEAWHFRIPLIDDARIKRLDSIEGCTDHVGKGRYMDISPGWANSDEGVPIYAVGDGIITIVDTDWNSGDGYGINVEQTSYGASFRYAHLAKTYVSQQQQVKQGDLIGLLGNTGNSRGAHLHWDGWIAENDPYSGIFDIQNVEEWDNDGADHDYACHEPGPGSITAESLDINHSYHPEGIPIERGCPNYFNAQAILRDYGINFVTLFDHSNCLGNLAHIFVPGSYNLDTEYGFNDRTRSLYIPPGWSVRLYAHTDSNSLYSSCRTVDMWNLDVDNYIQDSNTKIGWDRDFGLTNANDVSGTPIIIALKNINDFQSSVSNGWNMVSRIDVFDNDTCTSPPGGLPKVAFTQIGGTGGSGTGSLAPGDTVTVHADPAYNSTRYGWHDEGKWDLPDYMQNRVTSVGVQSGWSIALFDNSGQVGQYICINSDDPDLSDNTFSDGSNANNRAISAIVFNNNTCSGMEKPDLVAEEVFVSLTTGTTTSETLQTNEPAYIDWHFKNTGSTAASGQFHADIWIAGRRYVHHPYSYIGSQSSHGFTDWMEIVPDSGWLKVSLVVDPENVIDEVDETNNVWEGYFFWYAPDFIETAFGCNLIDDWKVMLMENPRCSGWYEWETLPGNWNLTLVDNNVSSIHIPSGGLSVMVYQDPNLIGQRKCIADNIDDLSQVSWPDGTIIDNSISSYEIFYNPYCIRQGKVDGKLVVYTDPNYGGSVASYYWAGKFPIPGNSDNRISSIGLHDGWSVMLFEGYNQTGRNVCIKEDESEFSVLTYDDGTPLNDTVSSLELFDNSACRNQHFLPIINQVAGVKRPTPVTPTPTFPTDTPTPTPTPTRTNTPVPSFTPTWTITPSLTPTPTRTRTPTPTSTSTNTPIPIGGFCDDFNTNELKPGWTWIDHLGDSSYSLTEQTGNLRIHAPDSGHDLYMNLNAPRIVQSITGDFVSSIKVSINPLYNYQGAGLLIWQDSDNYVRLERTLVQGIDMWYRVDGIYYGIEIPYTNSIAYLRLQRSGNTINAWYSEEGTTWFAVTTINFPAETTLQVGLVLINEWQDNPIFADFDYFELNSCTN